jgi:hypothetical protein
VYETLLELRRCSLPALNWNELPGVLAMKIPVFVSSPTSLSPSQEAARTVIIRQLEDNDLEARALGRSDYPTELPLREVLLIARHCSGGIIFGFEEFPARTVDGKSPALPQNSRSAHQFHSPLLGTIWSQAFFSGFIICFGVPRRWNYGRYIRYRRFRCFHSSYHHRTSKALRRML